MVSVDREDEDAFREGVGDVPKDTEYVHAHHICGFAALGEEKKLEVRVGGGFQWIVA